MFWWVVKVLRKRLANLLANRVFVRGILTYNMLISLVGRPGIEPGTT